MQDSKARKEKVGSPSMYVGGNPAGAAATSFFLNTNLQGTMLQPGFAIRTASVEEMFLQDLPEGVTLLPHYFEGETTRVMLKFAVSQQAVNNEKFDLNGFIKAKLDRTLTAIRHRQNMKELRLTRRLQVVIDPKSGHEKTQIYFHIEFAKE